MCSAAARAAASRQRRARAGALVACEAGAAGDLPSTVGSARWAFSVRPVSGWGAAGERQRATAGWLAALPVFEPHWQARGARRRGAGRRPAATAMRCGAAALRPANSAPGGAERADTDGAGARQRLDRVGRAAVRLCGRARVLREELGRRLPQPLVLGAVRGVRGRAGCRADLRGCARPAARAGPGTPGWPQQCLRCFSWATLLKLLLPCHATAAMEFMSPVRRAMSAECV